MAGVSTPVTVVTTSDDDPHRTTVSAFASLSLAPPMVLVSLDRQSELLARVERTGQFGVNVLSSAQAELALRSARRGDDRFEGLLWYEESGCPRLEGAAVWLGCHLADLVDGGDHRLALADVLRVRVGGSQALT